MAGFLERWQRGRRTARILADVHRHVAMAERAQSAAASGAPPPGDAPSADPPSDDPKVAEHTDKALARLADAREIDPDGGPVMDLLEARALFLAGRAADALPAAHRAASARPYDVDSRVTHGLVCLALDRLDEAGHEFDSVLEEFGGDPDAESGRRAVALARGRVPLDEHALPTDLHDAAVLLVRCWRAAHAADTRFAALQAPPPVGASPNDAPPKEPPPKEGPPKENPQSADPAVLTAVASAMGTAAPDGRPRDGG